ncbi:MAG: hypothetical protein HPY83_17600 [Anaerolineae bacterium]|nr:hypothetical protein [Anaerolineae bacterium]
MTRITAYLALLGLVGALAAGDVLPAFASGPPPSNVSPADEPLGPGQQSVTLNVTYLGDWPDEARQAFAHAAGIWAGRLNSSVAVAISAYWTPMFYSAACECQADWVVLNEALYPAALANAVSGDDRNGAAGEMMVTCNSNRNNWYYGTDGNPASYEVDLVTVATHELGHGLGLSSLMSVDWQGLGTWDAGGGYPSIYDRFLADSSGQRLLTTYPSPSTELAAQLTSGAVYFGGPHATAANGGAMPKLYAPAEWRQGSSIAHLDAATYQGTSNALMTPTLEAGEARHEPGAVALGMLQDLGWAVKAPPPPLPPGMDETQFLPLVLSFRAG